MIFGLKRLEKLQCLILGAKNGVGSYSFKLARYW